MWNLCSSLAAMVNDEGENDPSKINLDDTLIVISTEFGRTPFKSTSNNPNAASNGRDHWVEGYAVAMIGGPIQQRGVVGTLSDTPAGSDGTGTGLALSDYSPTDVRAACLVGLDINPFEGELYPVGDIAPSIQEENSDTAHEQTMINLRSTILGVS